MLRTSSIFNGPFQAFSCICLYESSNEVKLLNIPAHIVLLAPVILVFPWDHINAGAASRGLEKPEKPNFPTEDMGSVRATKMVA